MKQLVLFLLRTYKITISPLIGNHCRFTPTCSEYMMQSIAKYGLFKGIYLGTKRLLRCHPFHAGGVDPVP